MKRFPVFPAIMLLAALLSIQGGTAQSRLTPGEHFAPVNGITLHYYVAGRGPVCLVPSPGWGISVDYLYKSLTPLEKYFTMVFYDTRMSGKSTGPDDSTQYTSIDFMNDMESLRAYLGQQKIWLLGHSAGGIQTLFYAVNHTAQLNGIIVIDAIAGRDSFYLADHQRAIARRKGKPYYKEGYYLITHFDSILNHEDSIYYTFGQMLDSTLPFYFHDPSKIKDLPQSNSAVSDKARAYTTASHFSTEYLYPKLHGINVPALVIVGDDDFICPRASGADRIAKDIPNSTEIVIKDAGHFCWIEQPQQFFPACEKWLSKNGVKRQ
jgi:pimeloyl-ACP methyl ester carboxylesterase